MEAVAPEHVVRQVEALLARRRTHQARDLLKSALASHPDHTGLLLQSAWADYLDDLTDEALATVKQVLVSEPQDESARQLYFELLMQKEQRVEAEQVILDLLRDNPEQAHYYGRYAHLMLDALKLPKARQLAQEGLKYEPDDAECLSARTLCDFIEQRAGATSEGLQQLLVRHPQSIRTLILVVIALQERGDLDGARRVSQELVRAQPDNAPLVDIARQLKVNTHWSMIPMRPLLRWGWGASVVLWIVTVVVLRVVAKINPLLSGILAIVAVTYAVYTWVWPPLLKRLMRN